MKKTPSVQWIYFFMSGIFYAANATFASFGTLFLIDRSLSISQAGLVIAMASVISLILQAVTTTVLDRFPKLSIQRMLSICLFSNLLCLLLLMGMKATWATSLFFSLSFGFIFNHIPLLNSLYVDYQQSGFDMKYNQARALGSFSFALASFLLGDLLKKLGSQYMPVICFVLLASLLVLNILLPASDSKGQEVSQQFNEKNSMQSRKKVLTIKESKHLFVFLLLAVVMFYTMHNIISSYMLQLIQSVGGDESHLGVSMAIMAGVEIPVIAGYSLLAKKFGHRRLLMVSALGFVAKAATLILSQTISHVYLAQVLQMVSFGLYVVAIVHFTNSIYTREDAIKAQMYIGMASTLAGILGNVLGGIVLENYGVQAMLYLAGIASAIGLACFILAFQEPKEEVNS